MTRGVMAGALAVAGLLGGVAVQRAVAAPKVSRVLLFPVKVELAPGELSERLCVFVRLSNGKVGLRSQDVGSPCESLYRYQYVKSTRTLSPADQAVVDGVCMDFRVTGGTMTPAGCDRVLP